MLGLEGGSIGNEVLGLGASIATDPLTILSGAGLFKGLKMLRGGRAAMEAAPATRALAEGVETAAPLMRVAEEAPAVMKAIEAPLAPQFYSRLEQAATKMPETFKGESMMNLLKKQGGFAAEEAEFRNVGQLAKPGQKVSKPELLKHLDENQIGLQEVWKDTAPAATWTERAGGLESGGARIVREGDRYALFDNSRMRGTFDSLEQAQNASGVKPFTARYADYQTPGGQNYKEMLLTMESKPEAMAATAAAKGEFAALEAKINAGQKLTASEDAAYERLWNQFVHKKGGGAEYLSPHFSEPNILAHVRMQDRVGPGGKKILHLEEVQSDWHQAGKKAGYAKPKEDIAALENRMAELRQRPSLSPQEAEEMANLSQRYAFAMDSPGGIPNAPFKDTWHELAMKKMIRHAAENGYDELTWNTGKAIQKQVGGELAGQQKFYDEVLPNWMNKYAKKWGVEVRPAYINNPMTAEPRGARALQHGFALNDALKQEVLRKGQPLMAIPLAAILAGGGFDGY